MSVIGLDVGGTNIKGGLISEKVIRKRSTIPTMAHGTEEEVIGQICSLIDVLKDKDVEAIGMGYPAIVDPLTGTVFETVNIPSLKETPLGRIVGDRYKLPVFVNNDANCAALGEHYYGKGKGCDNLVVLTLGTGIGGGIISNGKLITGNNCGAGEFGEMPYRDSKLEAYCSGQFFGKLGVDAEKVFSAAKLYDTGAIEHVKKFGYHLGKGLAMVVHSVDPKMIILSGSISNGYSAFEGTMRKSLKESIYDRSYNRLKIEVDNNPDIPILGAASLYDNSII